jgi:GT2 family glycosyltransferase
MSLSVSVLITNYETWPDAARCARKVVEHSGDEVCRILVMDDASEASPPPMPEGVEVKQHDENQGFPSTLNSGFEALEEDVIVHFDADGRPLMNFAPQVADAFSSDERLGALGFHMVDHEGRPSGSYTAASEISALQFLVGQRFARVLRTDASPRLLLPNACGTAVRRRAFQEVEGFDEAYELLDVDLDFFLRLNEAGWEIEYDPEIRAYHEGGGSPQTTATRVLRHHRDRWRLLRKHEYVRHPALVKLFLMFRHLAEYALFCAVGPVMFDDSAWISDKIEGRHRLLHSVQNDYQEVSSSENRETSHS